MSTDMAPEESGRKKSGRFLSKKRYQRLQSAKKGYALSLGRKIVNVDDNNNVIIEEKLDIPNKNSSSCDTPQECQENEDIYPSGTSESESEEEHEEEICWRSGRRVVELGILVDNLEKGCAACSRPLDLRFCEDERRYGLGSLLYIRCQQEACSHLSPVSTGKRRNAETNVKCNNPAWEINFKVAAGIP
jgi:hypothetical protein